MEVAARGARAGGGGDRGRGKRKKKEAPLFRFGREVLARARNVAFVPWTVAGQQMGGALITCVCAFV